MRTGSNPNKIKVAPLPYTHQVVIPLYIPNHEGYFEESFTVFRKSFESLCNTVHPRTYITICENGCAPEIREELRAWYEAGKIHELISSGNIGKMNAVLKGIAGTSIPLITIADADVLFQPHWQAETVKVFNAFPKAGAVGLVPQIKMWEYQCANVILDHFLKNQLTFCEVDENAMLAFYDSIGWKRDVNPDYFRYALSVSNGENRALVGCGHFVATYRREVFCELPRYFRHKLGGTSETFLDEIVPRRGYYRLTTVQNLAYHIGNRMQPWVDNKMPPAEQIAELELLPAAPPNPPHPFIKKIKDKTYKMLSKRCYLLLLRRWKLPKSIASHFHQFKR